MLVAYAHIYTYIYSHTHTTHAHIHTTHTHTHTHTHICMDVWIYICKDVCMVLWNFSDHKSRLRGWACLHTGLYILTPGNTHQLTSSGWQVG
jgi:hypothetical protein